MEDAGPDEGPRFKRGGNLGTAHEDERGAGNLAFGAKLLSYMQTVRFFTDYLNGDTYYKIQHPEHNMQRTLAQFALLKSQEENFEKMKQIVFEAQYKNSKITV